MDEAMKTLRILAWVFTALVAMSSGSAETLSDPTRPVLPSVQSNAQSAPADSAPAPQVGVGMVVTAKEGVMALMDGRILRVGSRTDGGVVVQIAPDAVFVRSTEGKVTRLPLYPEVKLQAVTQVSPRATPARRGPVRSNHK